MMHAVLAGLSVVQCISVLHLSPVKNGARHRRIGSLAGK